MIRHLIILTVVLAQCAGVFAETSLRERLKASPFKIAYESYVNDNWEIFAMNADGSSPVNLTKTPGEHEDSRRAFH